MSGDINMRFEQVNTGNWKLTDGDKHVEMKGEFTVNGKTYEVSVNISKEALQGSNAKETSEKVQKFFDNFQKEHLAELSGHTMTASLDGKNFSIMKEGKDAKLEENPKLKHAFESTKNIVNIFLPKNPEKKEEIKPPVFKNTEKNQQILLKQEEKSPTKTTNKTDKTIPDKPPMNIQFSEKKEPTTQSKSIESKEDKERREGKEDKEEQPPQQGQKLMPPPSLSETKEIDKQKWETALKTQDKKQETSLPKLNSEKKVQVKKEQSSEPLSPFPENKNPILKEDSKKQEIHSEELKPEEKNEPKKDQKPEPLKRPPMLSKTGTDWNQTLEIQTSKNTKSDTHLKKDQSIQEKTNQPDKQSRFQTLKKLGQKIKQNWTAPSFSDISSFSDDFESKTLPSTKSTEVPQYIFKSNANTGPTFVFMKTALEILSSEQTFLNELTNFRKELESLSSGKNELETLKNALGTIIKQSQLIVNNMEKCVKETFEVDENNNEIKDDNNQPVVKERSFNLTSFESLIKGDIIKNYFSSLTEYAKKYEEFSNPKSKIPNALNKEHKNGSYFQSKIILPIQRGPKYPLFLRELINHASKESSIDPETDKVKPGFEDPTIKKAMPELGRIIDEKTLMTNSIKHITGLKFNEEEPDLKLKDIKNSMSETKKQELTRDNEKEINRYSKKKLEIDTYNKKQTSETLNKLNLLKDNGFPIGGLIQSLLKEKNFLDQAKQDGKILVQFQSVSGMKPETALLLLKHPNIMTIKKFKTIDKQKALEAFKDLKNQGWDVDKQIQRLEKKINRNFKVKGSQNFKDLRTTI